jgi:predicted aminopeptidase
MMRWHDNDLVAVLFHELAHQVVYVKDDSAFNESFATAVEEFGVQLWLEERGEQEKMAEYVAGRELQQSLTELVMKAREVLYDVYESDIELEYKRVLKGERLKTLAEDVAAELQNNGKEASGWLTGELNNARLISTTLYEGHLPSFRALYSRCEMQIDCFYTEAKKLADLNYDDRNAALSAGDLLRFGGGANEQ